MHKKPLGSELSVRMSKSNQTRKILPKTVTPTHYDVVLVPNPLPPFKYHGSVAIHFAVNANTRVISTNAIDLEFIGNAKLIVVRGESESKQESTARTYSEIHQTVVFEFADVIEAGSKAILEIEFIGEHNDKLVGFYRSAYKDSAGNEKFMLATLFQSIDARRAFPCADEPALKATFDVTLKVDPALTAMSNMNVVEETIVDGLKVVKFDRTPVMSTYLVAFALGEFEYIEAIAHPKKPMDAKPIFVRVYTAPGKKEEGRFGLDVSCKVLEYFSEYFDISYPLAKCDHVAIPDYNGAMEHWGLNTYAEHSLFYSESSSSARHKQSVTETISHEIAHQWFGNLVTMEWWNDLWLNEGFATFLGIMAADALFPEWDMWTNFVANELAGGLRVDSMRSGHPIEVELFDGADVNQIYDGITYYKGASLVRMLCATLGNEKFKNGIQLYLRRHMYANASTADLWAALSESTGVNVFELLNAWTKQMGFPLVTIEKEIIEDGKITLHLSQSQFLSTGNSEGSVEEVWFIPLRIVAHLNPTTPTEHILSTKTEIVTIPYSRDVLEYYKLNFNASGFYRVKLTEYAVQRFSKILRDKGELLADEDRVNLVLDTYNLARSGYSSMTTWLSIISNLATEKSFVVLDATKTNMSDFISILYKSSPNVKKGLLAIFRNIFAPKVSELGFEYSDSELYETRQIRTLVLTGAVMTGDPNTVDNLKRRFESFIAGDSSALHPDIRGLALRTAVKHSIDPDRTLNQLLDIFKSTTSEDLRNDALLALGYVNTFEHAKKVLALSSDPSLMKLQYVPRLWNTLASNSPIPELVREHLWIKFKMQFNELHSALAGSMGLFDGIARAAVQSRAEHEFADEVEAWMEGKDCGGEEREDRVKKLGSIKRAMEQAIERVRSNAVYLARDLSNVECWVSDATF
ncbi:peptidase family M1-domain-containing protein [Cladochytrium replicatum]|nr:peptidase family M1-domain-containing protein [Cladochytrium replicatum]